MTRSFEEWVQAQLAELEGVGRLRTPDDGEARRAAELAAKGLGVALIDASSNDYLGLARALVSRETSVQPGWVRSAPKEGAEAGAGAARLVNGTREEHVSLEQGLADWVGLPTALLFASGYAANVGLVSALAQPGSLVVSDRLNHASLIDGCRLSRARVEVVPHLNLDGMRRALESHSQEGPRLVLTESYFSMDGDGPDLATLRDLCDRHGAWLVVDEAHALGVFGPQGAGRCREAGVTPDVLVGTLGKSVGVQGAFVAGSSSLRTLLWNRARSFVFSTGSSPALARLSLFHVERARNADEIRARLHSLTAELRAELEARGVGTLPGSFGPIVPVLVGGNHRALAVARAVAAQGILAQGIRPPTVPDGTARLRVTVSASWPDGAPTRVAAAIAQALELTPS